MSQAILRSEPLTQPWAGTDPFLFCAHHLDNYPASDGKQAVPQALLGGRPLGDDFSRTDGYSMYYGTAVPGFPSHPHRGFETVTIVPQGLVDHSDSLGATARYGDGDVQWLTAGAGVMHAEMFPLRDANGKNLLDLYQIWLNLPARSKMAPPAFAMLWDGSIPRYTAPSGATVKVIAGAYAPQEKPDQPALQPPPATPHSWASNPDAELAIWMISIPPCAALTLPAARLERTRRTLYVHAGRDIEIEGELQPGDRMIAVSASAPLALRNSGPDAVKILLLQAVPIAEPVVAMGPFVMNTREEINQAHHDFNKTRFGGWPWPVNGPVHAAGQGRFALIPARARPNCRRCDLKSALSPRRRTPLDYRWSGERRSFLACAMRRPYRRSGRKPRYCNLRS